MVGQAEPSLPSAPIRVSGSAQPLQDQGFLEVSNWLSNRVFRDHDDIVETGNENWRFKNRA